VCVYYVYELYVCVYLSVGVWFIFYIVCGCILVLASKGFVTCKGKG